jgi:hypothetical protein
MNELQIIKLDNTDITMWDFPALKAELQASLSDFDGLVYTDNTIKDAKKDRTILSKAKKVVENARKAYKARCLEPYEAIEPQIKELTSLIEQRRLQIDETVKELECRQKEAKKKEVREYYDRISGGFRENAERIWEKIFDPKWVNTTTGVAKYREEIQTDIAGVTRGMESIKGLASPFEHTLTELYLDTLSMEAVLQKNEELKEAAWKAGIMGRTAGVVGSFSGAKLEEKPHTNEEEGILVRIHASQARLNQICDFMKAIGVTYEIV